MESPRQDLKFISGDDISLARQFVASPQPLLSGDVDQMAEVLLERSADVSGALILLQEFSDDNLVRLFREYDRGRYYNLEELRISAKKLRAGILEGLRKRDPEKDFLIATRKLHKEGENVSHNIMLQLIGTREHLKLILREHRHMKYPEAFQQFLMLPEHPAFVKTFGFDSEKKQAVVEHLNVRPLGDLMSLQRKHFSFQHLLRTFMQFLNGAEFLAKNGLILQDIRPANLGVDMGTGHGIYFDLDGISPIGVMDKERICPAVSMEDNDTDYRPPETYGRESPISTQEMIYQLGLSLRELYLSGYEFPDFQRVQKEGLIGLYKRMSHKDPAQRPDFATAKQKLQELIDFP